MREKLAISVTTIGEGRPARPRLARYQAETAPDGVDREVGNATWAARWLVGCMANRILATTCVLGLSSAAQ